MPTFRVPLAVAFGALACWLALAVTQPVGPGLDPDAVSYLAAARSLARSGTLTVPETGWDTPDSTTALTHFPPGYSAVLAVPAALGMSSIDAARLVQALAALVTVMLCVWLVSDAAGWWAGAAAGVTLLVTPALASVQESVLSEPLFLTLTALVLVLLTRPGVRPLAVGCAAAGAALVRYAGVSLVGGAALWWLLRPGTRRERVRGALLALLPGALALGAWVVRSATVRQAAPIRDFSIYGQLWPTVREGADTVATWLAPSLDDPWRVAVAVVVLALAVLVLTTAARGAAPSAKAQRRLPAPDRLRTLLAAVAVLGASYLTLVLLARVVADPGIPLDDRILSPLLMMVELAVVAAVGARWRAWTLPRRAAAALLLALWWAGSLSVALDDAQYAVDTGNDYADVSWSGSPLAAWVRRNAAGRALFTNFPTALYFHADRLSKEVPQSAAPDTALAFARLLRERDALVVVFDRTSRFVPSPDSLLARLRLRTVAQVADGTVYAPAPDSAPPR